MVNHSIKVYARLKKENDKYNLISYDIVNKKNGFDDIVFSKGNSLTSVGSHGFRFHKIFDQHSCQTEVFQQVAVPIINSVLEGFNGTIFAYGQTGSGKTFTITGSPKTYDERGIIPRCIQYIFRSNDKISEKPTIYLSYMEIYNEVGYDLLSPKQMNTAKYLEELPRITLLEDKNGAAHIRNLSVLPVTTEKEAMRLLFLGDTNRTIAETPMNEYSSRSHCIFTIYLTHRAAGSKKLRFSKLHLVDLAGSERVSKSLSTGQALNEAKHINLSLHFLQQVILALSECRRTHIPYRNSMMTLILKDSLSGNCLTSMLATLAISKNNILETISTCRFAQRVSMISTEPVINEIIDPQQEISFLRNKIEELERELASSTGLKKSSTLTDTEKSRCQYEVKQYLEHSSNNDMVLEPDLRQIQFCFGLLKKEFTSQKQKWQELRTELEDSKTEIDHLKKNVLKKDEQIKKLKKTLDKTPACQVDLNHHEGYYNLPKIMTNETNKDEEAAKTFNTFHSTSGNPESLSFYKSALEKKLEMAKIYSKAIKQCQKNISYIKLQLETCGSCYQEKSLLIRELHEQQEIYKKALSELKEIENETQHLEYGLKQEEYIAKHSQEWLKGTNSGYTNRHFVQPFETIANCEAQHCCSSNSETPICRIHRFEYPVCTKQTHLEHQNERMKGIFTCTNQYPRPGTSTSLHNNPYQPETNLCPDSRCCQMLQPTRMEDMPSYQNAICSRIKSCRGCYERADSAPRECNDSGDDGSDYYEEEPKNTLMGTEDVCYAIRSEEEDVEDDSGDIFQTPPEIHECTEEGEHGRNVENEMLCSRNANGSEIFYKETDSKEFREFMETVTLTGDPEIDGDIFNFYRTKF